MKKLLIGLIIAVFLVALAGIVMAKGGFDEFGYNYKANIFNGRYCDYDRVIGGDDCDVSLQMKWNDAWLDENRNRHVGYDSYIGSGAWLTNHMRGKEEGVPGDWTYFVKIVARPDEGYECPDDSEIWGSFCIIQEINSGHGDKVKYAIPGFGIY